MTVDDWLRFAAVAIGTAFAIWTGYMHASLKFESKAARLAFKRRDDALGLWRSAFQDPRKALDEALGVLYRNNDGTLAKAIESAYAANTQRYETHLANDRRRASRLHRRAQKAEGLLARREADLTKARTRASRMHRRAQKAEGELARTKERLKWHCFKCSEEAREDTSQTERLAELVGNPTFMSEPEESADTSGLTREDFALLEEE